MIIGPPSQKVKNLAPRSLALPRPGPFCAVGHGRPRQRVAGQNLKPLTASRQWSCCGSAVLLEGSQRKLLIAPPRTTELEPREIGPRCPEANRPCAALDSPATETRPRR